jgi:two-component SAPR family response regulator
VAAALELGVEPEFARGIVRRKQLAPPPPADDVGPYWPWPVTIRSLGACSVTLAGPQGPDKTHAPSALLELLIARRGEALPLAQAARELWPSRSVTASRSAFDTAVHRLRRALGNDTLVALEGGAIRLAREHIWVDVWALEPLATSIERLPAEASAHDVERLAGRLLDLYRGPFGSGTAGAASARCRDKASRRFVASVEQLSQHLLRLGLPRAQADLLERAALRDDACKRFEQLASKRQLSPARVGQSPLNAPPSHEPDAGPL